MGRFRSVHEFGEPIDPAEYGDRFGLRMDC